MPEIGMIPIEYMNRMRGPDVRYALLGRFDFASGSKYLWSGAGRLETGGHTWLGVTDPAGTRMVKISEVGLPEPNVATAINIALTGIDAEFVRNVYENAHTVEGRSAELFLQVFEDEMQPLGAPMTIDPASYMTSAKYRAVRNNVREISITIEGTWSAKNFPPGAQLTDADQQRRNPGDRVCKYAGWVIEEVWGPSG